MKTWRGIFEPSENTYPCGIILVAIKQEDMILKKLLIMKNNRNNKTECKNKELNIKKQKNERF